MAKTIKIEPLISQTDVVDRLQTSVFYLLHGAYVHRHVVCMQQLTLHPCPPPPTKKFQIQVPHKIIISNDYRYIYKKKESEFILNFELLPIKAFKGAGLINEICFTCGFINSFLTL